MDSQGVVSFNLFGLIPRTALILPGLASTSVCQELETCFVTGFPRFYRLREAEASAQKNKAKVEGSIR
jgi:hypothetical protein